MSEVMIKVIAIVLTVLFFSLKVKILKSYTVIKETFKNICAYYCIILKNTIYKSIAKFLEKIINKIFMTLCAANPLSMFSSLDFAANLYTLTPSAFIVILCMDQSYSHSSVRAFSDVKANVQFSSIKRSLTTLVLFQYGCFSHINFPTVLLES